MPLDLPRPIQAYFESENAHDAEAVEHCFAPDATVRDEAQTISGFATITAWRLETARKYAHRVEPTRMAERDGRIVVSARVSGNFPGSPVSLDHTFRLDGDRIAELEIR